MSGAFGVSDVCAVRPPTESEGTLQGRLERRICQMDRQTCLLDDRRAENKEVILAFSSRPLEPRRNTSKFEIGQYEFAIVGNGVKCADRGKRRNTWRAVPAALTGRLTPAARRKCRSIGPPAGPPQYRKSPRYRTPGHSLRKVFPRRPCGSSFSFRRRRWPRNR